MRIVYTSSERFMNEMITCIKTRPHAALPPALPLRRRAADRRYSDPGRQGTHQEEFFHTFNELYEHQKQIVISSDSPPKNTPGLVERLRSRFEWGLMVDVQPPDLETKMAILDKKAEAEGVTLPEEVRIFIATKTKSNVRELEGALIKLIAYSSVTGYAHHAGHGAAGVEASDARAGAPDHHGIHRQGRGREVLAAAGAAQAEDQRAEDRLSAPDRHVPGQGADSPPRLPEIGRAFGGKHHTTVLHSMQKIDRLRQRDPDLNSLIHKLIDSIH